MSTALRRVGTAGFSASLLAVVVLLGQVPWGSSTGEAVLRLALRTVRGKIEVCHEPSPEELAALPPHMRQPEICDTYPVRYRLRMSLDGRLLVDETVEAGGLRRDRPHNVDREFTVGSGTRRLEVGFRPQMPEDAAPEVREEFSGLPTYELARDVRLTADRVALVYLDDSTGTLELVQD